MRPLIAWTGRRDLERQEGSSLQDGFADYALVGPVLQASFANAGAGESRPPVTVAEVAT
jgi:hypothetical protein